MTTETSPTPAGRLSGTVWLLALIPFILLGMVLAYIVATGGGLTELAGPPIEQISIPLSKSASRGSRCRNQA